VPAEEWKLVVRLERWPKIREQRAKVQRCNHARPIREGTGEWLSRSIGELWDFEKPSRLESSSFGALITDDREVVGRWARNRDDKWPKSGACRDALNVSLSRGY